MEVTRRGVTKMASILNISSKEEMYNHLCWMPMPDEPEV